ncbi:MAG TPA: adenosylmethionine decarboxylase [Polyangiaceae bacterium LLY-WYZ-15_(1-7)]|nr:adenosylmethionine decarboxylase [Polyangiaceae bacterium LLY-WYZ-15_(1-7)]HJL01835.1 adenosylmethionine decarboxylase [Polyangiaceae bacterium LLY-WYZ-15_(1-7)]HJL09121.1 adenosylmethionine decarboxylase [Polyangiaceae bacterium LLY-WYZ-15_(1-7)]HJL22958.1 adenosylmethionine decarboxylase [Polyangiaceae bacterium LLY-WYZ-15_(1-7)]HJL29292.1 adenosylmethionine decarboxylase [Polyangiaceae bacterium LLY-WYZ-15_(1-7)]
MSSPLQAATFFEGPEKKVELVLTPDQPSLRARGEAFWREVVDACQAQVLSVIRDEVCDAYLLSESSLFVYDGYLTMITCGRTRLVDAVFRVLEAVGRENVALLIYERKNEHWPERQPSTFYDDAHRLNTALPGRAFRFGDEHDHHVHLFHTTRPFEADAQDTTLEILMHGLPEDAASRFVGCDRPADRTLAEARGITAILPGFTIDEHPFTPAGYSMNGLRDGAYYTIHVTPEALGSYVSFETNADFRGDLNGIVDRVLEVFRPRSFDVMAFAPAGTLDERLAPTGYAVKDQVGRAFGGYDVRFWHSYRPAETPREAVEVAIAAR